MRYSITAAALFAASVTADLCAHGSTDDNGNYYCQQVNAITYTGVGGSASYNKVTSMDSTSGTCGSTPFGYGGSLAPLNEEVSMHFRGPLQLKQFAYYAPSSSTKKREAPAARRSAHERRHGLGHGHGHAHQHLHKPRAAAAEPEAALGDIVTATINGQVVHWANDFSGAASTAAPAPADSYGSAPAEAPANSSPVSAAPESNAPASYAAPSSDSGSSDSSSSSSDDNEAPSVGGSGWTRQGYYNSDSGTSQGIVFLNHEGGSGSGCFDYTFGNSLSYASSNGCSGASGPQTLEDTTLPSDAEVIIMTDNKCSGDDCGFVRPDTVAYHGFDGPSKAFFFEFQMPDSGETSASIYDPVNMPAIWLLNAQIPRTLQYGNAECSCWQSGCGEFDIFEVLAPGDDRCKSTLHGNIAGGDSDYFARPTNAPIKAALLMYEDNIHIKILDDDTDFGSSMPDSFFTEMIADTAVNSLENLVSLFQLSG